MNLPTRPPTFLSSTIIEETQFYISWLPPSHGLIKKVQHVIMKRSQKDDRKLIIAMSMIQLSVILVILFLNL